MARIADRDGTALLELRDRLGDSVFDRAFGITGDRLVAMLVTSGVLMMVWRCPAAFAGSELRVALPSLAEQRARQWLASTADPTATTLVGLTWPGCGDAWEDETAHTDHYGHNSPRRLPAPGAKGGRRA